MLGEVSALRKSLEVARYVLDERLSVELKVPVVICCNPASFGLGITKHYIGATCVFDLGYEFAVHIHVLVSITGDICFYNL
jgi:hypothetical protein